MRDEKIASKILNGGSKFSAAELELIRDVLDVFNDEWGSEPENIHGINPDFFTEVLVKVRILVKNQKRIGVVK